MKVERLFHVIDSHTAGNPTRLLLEGIPSIPGKSMAERKRYLQRHFDYIRTTLMQEPRGNSGVAAILLPPCDSSADYGVVFCDFRGYVDMCIHGTIGVVTTLVECGYLATSHAKEGIVFDTPAGLVRARARISGGKVSSVSVSNVPSFFVKEVTLSVPEFGEVQVSIAFGGNTYAYVRAKDVRARVAPRYLKELLSKSRLLLTELHKMKLSHPHLPAGYVLGVSLYEDITVHSSRNIMVADDDLYDRSPCGTGTCGRMAILHFQNKLPVGAKFVNQSIIGTQFVGLIVKQIVIGNQRAVLPEITGTAYMTGISDIIMSEGDKLARGFLVG